MRLSFQRPGLAGVARGLTCLSPLSSHLPLPLPPDAPRTRKKRCPYSKFQIRELEREFFFNVYNSKTENQGIHVSMNYNLWKLSCMLDNAEGP